RQERGRSYRGCRSGLFLCGSLCSPWYYFRMMPLHSVQVASAPDVAGPWVYISMIARVTPLNCRVRRDNRYGYMPVRAGYGTHSPKRTPAAPFTDRKGCIPLNEI